jgi:hypothetical protein
MQSEQIGPTRDLAELLAELEEIQLQLDAHALPTIITASLNLVIERLTELIKSRPAP